MVNKKKEEIIFSMMWHIGVGDFSMHCARLIESVFPPASSFTFPIHPIAMLQCFNQRC
jgi:hypothetical protein